MDHAWRHSWWAATIAATTALVGSSADAAQAIPSSHSKPAAKRSDHWAFKTPKRPAIPLVSNTRWVASPIDAFVLARLEKEKIKPAPPAERLTLIRRLSLDLTGLPPTPAEVDAFVNDRRGDAYKQLVDRLLASPHFGERWGKHWLDVARYADTDGYTGEKDRPYAWRFRNWVIDAFNNDLPFDQFTIEQLAGDLLPNATTENRVATGFHRNTLINRETGTDPEEFRVRQVVDRVNTTGTAWLGLTIACAECHSHKYDPITQREYYGLYAFFNSVKELDIPAPLPNEPRVEGRMPLLTGPAGTLPANLGSAKALNAPLTPSLSPSDGERVSAGQVRGNQEESTPVTRTAPPDEKPVARPAKATPTPPVTMAQVLEQLPEPRKTFIHVRGDFLRHGEEVLSHTLAVLPPLRAAGASPSRLDFARWLVSPEHPVTARVAVNRLWQHLFGYGLVRTENDFGVQSDPPTHPELLDWLANEFMARGWSTKEMIRLIVSSSTYRQSSTPRPELESRDPKNLLQARQNRFRVEAEIVRDMALSASGLLDAQIGGPSFRPPVPDGVGNVLESKWPNKPASDQHRRGMYIVVQRTIPYPMLTTFDAPDGNVTCTRRDRSNTPLQALTLLNDRGFFECARALGLRLAATTGQKPEAGIRQLFELCLARAPQAWELSRCLSLFAEQSDLYANDPDLAQRAVGSLPPASATQLATCAAWIGVARTVMNTDEFITRE